MVPIEALIFDAEGVVIDTMRSVWIPADVEFCRRRGFDYPEELMGKLAGSSLLDGVRIMKDYHGFDGDDEILVKERLEIADELFQKGVSFVEGFEDFYSKQSLPAAIGTSLKPKYLDVIKATLPVDQLFNGHVYSIYEIGAKSKPNPDIFLYAAKQLGVEKERCLVFEDAPNGIESARRAGMRCVAITTSFPREALQNATLIVDSYKEINLQYLQNQPTPK